MKSTRPRLSRRELMLLVAPYPLLWLYLGCFVDPAVFKFWVSGQSISPLDAMTLGFVPLCFSAIYLPAMLLTYRAGEEVTSMRVLVYALIAAFVGFIMTPLP